jgi:beta-phosphoglucomutase-like phosphatase (HAD superfamily)
MTTLLLDCDGVLADTERFGHLPAFNTIFAAEGLPVRWTEEEYAEKLKIGGGKERMASLLTDDFTARHGLPSDPEGRRELLLRWHRRKTAAYKELVAAGVMPGRPGIARLVGDALDAGWTVAVASTSAVESVQAVLEHAVGAEQAARIAVFAGDVVPAKKPDPAIYRLALEQTGSRPQETLVVEDSRNGLLAAVGAGLRCLVTISSFTKDEDFSEAVLVVTSLGDPGEPTQVLANRSPARPGDYITLDDLQACLEVPTPQEVP